MGFVVLLWVALLLLTTVDIAHNTPANTLTETLDKSLTRITLEDIYDHGLTAGITYGTIGVRVWNQWSMGFRLGLGGAGLTVAILLEILRWTRREFLDSRSTLIGAGLTGICLGFLYFVVAILVLEMTPAITYIPSDAPIARESVIANWEEIPMAFWGLLLAQTAAVSLVSVVLTTEIVPEDIGTERRRTIEPRWTTEREVNTARLEQHARNWWQYGTWLVSLFVSVGLAGSLVFITDVAPFGRSFVLHAVVPFGGALALVVGFVSYKLSRLERQF